MEAGITSYSPTELKCTKTSLIDRLRAVAIKTIAAAERVTAPTTPLECDRMAKAILTLEKVVEKLFGEDEGAETEEDEMNDGERASDIYERMERKLADLSAARAAAGVVQKPSPEQLDALRRQLGLLDAGGRTDSADG